MIQTQDGRTQEDGVAAAQDSFSLDCQVWDIITFVKLIVTKQFSSTHMQKKALMMPTICRISYPILFDGKS